MHSIFIEKIREYFPQHNFSPTSLIGDTLFVYEGLDRLTHFSKAPIGPCFQLTSEGNDPITHICIDGDFIPKSLENYVNDGTYSQKRPDSMLFNSYNLVFLELKLNVTTTNERNVGRNFKEALDQLEIFILFFMKGFSNKGDRLSHYFNVTKIHAVVCLCIIPKKFPSAQRNTQIESFYSKTNIRPVLLSSFNF